MNYTDTELTHELKHSCIHELKGPHLTRFYLGPHFCFGLETTLLNKTFTLMVVSKYIYIMVTHSEYIFINIGGDGEGG